MIRPSEAEVDEALLTLSDLVTLAANVGDEKAEDGLSALDILYRATRPVVYWSSREVAEALSSLNEDGRRVDQRNLARYPGVIPELVAVEIRRPASGNPDAVWGRLYDRDKVEAFVARRRRERAGR